MKVILILLLLTLPFSVASQCNLEDYQKLLKEAKTAQKQGKYDLAINKLTSAQTCRPEMADLVRKQMLEVFNEVNQQRKDAIENGKKAEKQKNIAEIEKINAERRLREVYATDLIFKSRSTLTDGNLSVAFCLAEFAQKYVIDSNLKVTNALFETLYYNDYPDSTHRLPWHHNLGVSPEDAQFVLLSPNGRCLVTINNDSLFSLWDYKVEKRSYTMKLNTGKITDATISNNGRYLLIRHFDYNLEIWDLEKAKLLVSLHYEDNLPTTDIALSSTLQYFATVEGLDNRVKIWNLQAEFGLGLYSPKFILNEHSSEINDIDFSSDGKLLASGSKDKTAKIWNLNTGRSLLTLEGHSGEINKVAFSPDEQLLATASNDKTIKIWDLKTGHSIITLEGNRDKVLGIVFSPDGQSFATWSSDKTIKIWDLNTHSAILTFKGHDAAILEATFSADGNTLITTSNDKTIKIWNLNIHKAAQTLETTNHVRKVACSPDGQNIAIWDQSGLIINWQFKKDSIFYLRGFKGFDAEVAFSPSLKNFAFSHNNSLGIWDCKTGKRILEFEGHESAITDVSFSADGNKIASSSFDGVVKIWDLSNGNCLYTLNEFSKYVSCIAFSQDGQLLAAGSPGDRMVKIWDLRTGQAILNFGISNNDISSIVFSPDGQCLAVAQHFITIWSLSKGNVIFRFDSNEGEVRSVAFSPNGQYLASGADDKKVKLWNLNTGQLTLTIEGHTKSILSVAFSPDGQQIISGSIDHMVKIWNCSPNLMIEKACQLAPKVDLTLAELVNYGLENLLDQLPDNEFKLIATQNTWQIAAFADLYTQKIIQPGIPKKENYDRAKRLYLACLSHNVDNSYFEKKLANLERFWRDKTK